MPVGTFPLCHGHVQPARRQGRRQLLATLALAPWLAGCGFRLRGAPDFTFDDIWLGFPPSSAIGLDLRRALTSGGTLRVVEERAQAQVWLEVLIDAQERVVLATNAVGQVREVQLRRRLRYSLVQPDGRFLIREDEIVQARDLAFDESAALARLQEETLVYRSMRADIVAQLVRRLAAVRL